jgi:tetrahydromethanopterin S-methyltransferase subunit C
MVNVVSVISTIAAAIFCQFIYLLNKKALSMNMVNVVSVISTIAAAIFCQFIYLLNKKALSMNMVNVVSVISTIAAATTISLVISECTDGRTDPILIQSFGKLER